ncbi:unnamed protein product, partial [Rhizoctonia solani]
MFSCRAISGKGGDDLANRGRLAGKSVIITGAASGIGLGTAELFIEEGAKLVLVDLQREKLEQAVARLQEAGGACAAVCGDVSEPYTITRAVRSAIEAYGKIDIVFNNAGIMPTGPVTEYPDESWDRVMAVNLKSMFLMCKAVIPEMLKQGGGSIINTSSVMAGLTEPGYTAYTASKAGIIGLTKEIAVSYSEQGIRCNAICPGWVDTEMNRKVAEDMGGWTNWYRSSNGSSPWDGWH